MRRLAEALWALRSVAMLVGGIASSTEAETEPEVDRWQFELAPYVWIPKVDGRVTAGVRLPGGVAVPVTATVNESGLPGGSAHFEARRHRLTLFLNATGTSFETVGHLAQVFGDATTGQVNGDLALVEVGTAYRVFEWRFSARAPRSFWIEALAGGRYVHLANDVQVKGVAGSAGPFHFEAKVDANVADPFIGGRWSVALLDNLPWLFSGDVGGFGAGTKRTWQIVSTLRYRLPWAPCSRPVWASAGYHLIDLDERGEKIFGRDTGINLEFRGPIVGAGDAVLVPGLDSLTRPLLTNPPAAVPPLALAAALARCPRRA